MWEEFLYFCVDLVIQALTSGQRLFSNLLSFVTIFFFCRYELFCNSFLLTVRFLIMIFLPIAILFLTTTVRPTNGVSDDDLGG